MSSESSLKVAQALDALYEFEREPVSEDRLQPGKYFAGLFAGEHVAGTEFVIGFMFVAWGVTAFDIFVGLLVGNLLAVLTWTLICAPVAVDARLTLYWYLRKVAGPLTTTIYNILNAFLFCILAGCMITVSASAVRIPFGIPAQTHWYPGDVRFVLVVFLVGAVVTLLAILGFKRLAQFSTVCSPWMFLMFVAGAIVLLPQLVAHTEGITALRSFSDFWKIATTVIWKGPQGSEAPMTFWHVAAFAWICNLAMHGGMSDMALFRYAKSSWYGLYSACGMFLGHYLAWICAGVMGAATALMLQKPMSEIDSGMLAMHALGISGIIAVVIAGWTTSNPTLYRAGLALQAITPGWPRWKVTLIAGIVTTVVACFPFVFTGLLNFVGLYGLLLMPAGAIVFAEHWIFPRLGLQKFWATRGERAVSWPSLAAWGIAIAVAITLERSGILHLFFLFLPVWFLTIVLYIVLSILAGAKKVTPETPGSEKILEKKPATSSTHNSARTHVDGATLLSGAIALTCLAICLIWPLWILLRGTDGYEARFAEFKLWLILPTLIYFVAGTIYLARREKQTVAP